MIKNSTVFKRMIASTWKPITVGMFAIGTITLISVAAGRYFDIDPNMIYWGMILVILVGTGVKWSYDWHRSAIELEQKQLMRDLEKKHL